VAAIEGDDGMGAGGARVLTASRSVADSPIAPRPPGRALAMAAIASFAVHAAIVAAAALSLGPAVPTGEPDSIAVELVASTEAATAAASPHAEPTPAPPPARGDPPAADVAPPPPAPAKVATADATDAPATAPIPRTADAAPPAARDAASPSAEAPQPAATLEPTPPPTPAAAPDRPDSPKQADSVPPEADFAATSTSPQIEARPSARPVATGRVLAPRKPASPPAGARAATVAARPAATSPGAALSAYRNALQAKIWGEVRYPDVARERGATGVATVHFALDDVGAVTLADLAQSSGDRALDDEALSAVRRASPLPAPPAGAPRAYSAPIRFELR
jgi:protein TonB